MQPIDNTSTKALSPDCGMVSGKLESVQPVEGGIILATIGYTCQACGCPQARARVVLPGDLTAELQTLVGQVCRICRGGERYIVRGGTDE